MKQQRMLAIFVERFQDEDAFSTAVAEALREYAACIDAGHCGPYRPDEFHASNGCVIAVASGAESTA